MGKSGSNSPNRQNQQKPSVREYYHAPGSRVPSSNLPSAYGYTGMTPGFGDPLKTNDGYQFPILEQQYLPQVNPYAQISHGERQGAMRPVRGVTMQDARGPPSDVIIMQHTGRAGVKREFEIDSRLFGSIADSAFEDGVIGDFGHYGV